jgi:surfactin synthase thioesterase subunit
MDVYVDTPRWLARGKARPGRLRLYCFPHGGGSAAEYLAWGRDLPGLEVCAIQLPGRGSRMREQSFTGMADLVAAVADKIPFGSHGSFAFFGHSFGAVVAYEVSRLLRDRGRSLPEHLVVSGYPAPSRRRVPVRQPVHRLPDDELIDEVARRHGGFPPEVLADARMRSMLTGSLRADYQVLETYRWREDEPLPIPMTVLGGRQDSVTVDELYAWQRHSTEPITVRLIPGGHFFLREQPAATHRAIMDALAATPFHAAA